MKKHRRKERQKESGNEKHWNGKEICIERKNEIDKNIRKEDSRKMRNGKGIMDRKNEMTNYIRKEGEIDMGWVMEFV